MVVVVTLGASDVRCLDLGLAILSFGVQKGTNGGVALELCGVCMLVSTEACFI